MNNTLFSQDAETAVLSLIIKNGDLAFTTDGLRATMFSSLSTQCLFSNIEDLKSRNITPDAHTILLFLESNGQLNRCGGKEFIDLLESLEYPKENFNEFIRLMMESHKARTLSEIIKSVDLKNLTSGTVNSIIQSLKAGLDALTETSFGQAVAHIGDLVSPYYNELVERIKTPGIRGVKWGIKPVDLNWGGKAGGDLWFIAARPSQGKTALICNTALNDGLSGEPCLIISREMTSSQLLERLLSTFTGIDGSKIRLGLVGEQMGEIEDALKVLKKLPIYVDTNFNMNDEFYLESVIRKYHSIHKVKTVYIDYIQLLVDRDENQTNALGRVSKTLKRLAGSLDISIVVLSQLNREVEKREDKRPILSDMRQSGNLEEDADWVVGLYREVYYIKDTKNKNTMEFIVLKARNGPVGTVLLKFTPEITKIEEAF